LDGSNKKESLVSKNRTAGYIIGMGIGVAYVSCIGMTPMGLLWYINMVKGKNALYGFSNLWMLNCEGKQFNE
jgi:hypothetical protein